MYGETVVFRLLQSEGHKVCRNCYLYFGGIGGDYVKTVRCAECIPQEFEDYIKKLTINLGPFVYSNRKQFQYEIDVVSLYLNTLYIIEAKDYTNPIDCEMVCYHYARARHFAQRAHSWYAVYATTSGFVREVCVCNGYRVRVSLWRSVHEYPIKLYKLISL